MKTQLSNLDMNFSLELNIMFISLYMTFKTKFQHSGEEVIYYSRNLGPFISSYRRASSFRATFIQW